jgi:hypothetical protein
VLREAKHNRSRRPPHLASRSAPQGISINAQCFFDKLDCWQSHPFRQPQSGERMQPTAQAVGKKEKIQPAPAGRKAHTARNFPFPGSVHLNRKTKLRRSPHSNFPPLVHPLRILLAAGDPGAGSLPVRLAASTPIPHPRCRGPRNPRDHLPRHHTPVPPASRPISNLGRTVEDLSGSELKTPRGTRRFYERLEHRGRAALQRRVKRLEKTTGL